MVQKTTGIRKGIIDEIEVEFTVTSKFNGVHVCGAEGHFYSPDDVYQVFGGVNKTLTDNVTDNMYEIFVADDRFSFSCYSKIDVLF